MKKVRFAAAALCTLLAAQSLIACGDTGKTDPSATEPVSTEPVTEASTDVKDDLGDLSFGGKTFTMYLAFPVGGYIMEEQTGDILDDSIFERNRQAEERLDIKLNYIKSEFDSTGGGQGSATSQIRTFILAGDTTNDVYVHVQHSGMPGMIAENMFVDWNDVPNIDFTKPYWYQRCLDDINYYDKVYAMTGAYNLNTLNVVNCLYFNKRIMNDLDMTYPYQDVLDGKWTVDKFQELLADAVYDLNGDGVIDKENDRLGFWGWGYEQIPAFFMGMGGDLVYKDNDGSPVININNERTSHLVDELQETFKIPGVFVAYDMSEYPKFNTLFMNGQLLFVHGGLNNANGFRDMEDDFGFIPYPKLDESQEGYVCRVQNTSSLTYIPTTNVTLDFTGACLEVLACTSYNTVMPTFFDKVLTVKTVRDVESEQMVPIIRESCSFFDEAVEGFAVREAALGTKGLASYWASIENKVVDSVQKNIIDVYGD